MSTRRIPILGFATKPDNSGNVFFEPAAINFAANDLYHHLVAAFKDTSTKDILGGAFVVPKDYVGSPKIIALWAAIPTTGDVVWDFDYRAIADAESLDPTTHQESLTVTTTVPGTARQRVTSSMSLTAANLAVDDVVLFHLARDGAAAGDTLAGVAYLVALLFEYTDA
jgi:hypothetical protein